MFVFQVDKAIECFKKYLPDIWKAVSSHEVGSTELHKQYEKVKAISFDVGIMEKLESLVCVPCDIGWNDLGSWDEMASVERKEHRNQINLDAKDSVVHPIDNKKLYALVGTPGITVVDTKDVLLVLKQGQGQRIKELVEKVKKLPGDLIENHMFEYRPWGKFEILSNNKNYKSKIITVDPGHRLSYQSHQKRSEHWVIVSGQGQVTLDDKEQKIKAGDHVHIPVKSKHRIANTGKEALQFIEVQTGTYFGEDDIERFQDDYSREKS